MSELLTNRSEFNSETREAVLGAIKKINFESEGGPNYDELFELIPELRELDFGKYHPVHPYSVLEHSIRSAQMANTETAALALIFHDIAKSLKQCQVWVKNTTPDGPDVMKSPDHEIEGVKPAEEFFRKYGLARDQEELDLMLDLVRYHDSWGHSFDRDFDEIVDKFDSETIEILFDVQKRDLETHSDEYYVEKIKYLEAAQEQIRKKIASKYTI